MAAKLIPALIVIFSFSLLLSSSHAESPVTSTEDDVTNTPPASFNEEDVSDLKSVIVLPTENQLKSDAASGKFTGEFQDLDIPAMKSIGDGEKKLEELNPRAMSRQFERMRAIRCRHGHRGPRFSGGAQIRPMMPFWKEEHDEDHRRRHHHGEIFSGRRFDGPRVHEMDPARIDGVDGDGRMIGEFKQPHFFFRHHHHHYHHHDDDEDQFHHHHHHDDEEDHFHHHGEEEMEHHRHRRGHGFWRTIRKFLGHY